MAARALTAAGRRVAGRTGTTPLLASRRNGVSMNHSSASARREEEQYQDVRTAAAAMTGAQAVFVREEDIEDVEKPAAIDMGNANADVNGSIKNY
uniref:Uncharacterized protein n=1 Tax=Aegilops tauschii TaxID=37682 RepID=R7W8L2_AEGTA